MEITMKDMVLMEDMALMEITNLKEVITTDIIQKDIMKVLLKVKTMFALMTVVQTEKTVGVMKTVWLAKMDGDLKVVMLHYVKNHVVNAKHVMNSMNKVMMIYSVMDISL